MSLGTRIRELRHRKNMTQEELAAEAKIAPSYVGHIEAGRRQPSKEIIRALAEVLETSTSDLLAAAGYIEPATRVEAETLRRLQKRIESMQKELRRMAGVAPPNMIPVPLLGYVPAGALFPEEEYREGFVSLPNEWLKGTRHPYLLMVSGDSMVEQLHPGDMIVVDPDRQWMNGSIVVVRVANEVTVKQIYKEDHRVRLVPANVKHKAIEIREQEVEVLGVVIRRIKAEEV